MKQVKDYLPQRKTRVPEPITPTVYITPYLPPEAEKLITDHERWNGQPAFVLAMAESPECPNCGGGGVIFVRFCAAGPLKSPTQKLPVTWYDGDGKYGKGWYTIKETKSFPCPECLKKGLLS